MKKKYIYPTIELAAIMTENILQTGSVHGASGTNHTIDNGGSNHNGNDEADSKQFSGVWDSDWEEK
jgi:hypothetical protein